MSEKNGKVCCNCRHNIRTGGDICFVTCHCDIDDSWLSYITVMTHWCRHWSRDKAESEIQETETWNGIHAQITAPKGTFDKIWEDAESEEELEI